MPHVRLVADGQVLLDHDLDAWSERQPEELTNLLATAHSHATPRPWMKAALMAVADAVLIKTATDIQVRTEATGWTLSAHWLSPGCD